MISRRQRLARMRRGLFEIKVWCTCCYGDPDGCYPSGYEILENVFNSYERAIDYGCLHYDGPYEFAVRCKNVYWSQKGDK